MSCCEIFYYMGKCCWDSCHLMTDSKIFLLAEKNRTNY